METRKLGYSDLQLTTVGLGTWAMGGGGWKFGWGHQEDQESIDAIRKAHDLGINWIDTAAIYSHGHAEEEVGKAISGIRDGSGRMVVVKLANLLPETAFGEKWKTASVD